MTFSIQVDDEGGFEVRFESDSGSGTVATFDDAKEAKLFLDVLSLTDDVDEGKYDPDPQTPFAWFPST